MLEVFRGVNVVIGFVCVAFVIGVGGVEWVRGERVKGKV